MGPAANPQNRWAGNRGGYEESVAQQLIGRYYSSLSEPEQFQAMRDLAEFMATELPLLPIYFSLHHTGVRKGVVALGRVAGGQQSSPPYGTYGRNAHRWDLE